MSRPKPTILLEAVNKHTYKAEQVLVAEAIFSVFYDGNPINLRTLNTLVSYPGPKYKKVSFSNSGHAFNLAARLNKMFDTDKFEVLTNYWNGSIKINGEEKAGKIFKYKNTHCRIQGQLSKIDNKDIIRKHQNSMF